MIGDVRWSSPGQTSADSLPLGNGNLAANVWTEPAGDLVFYLAKNDAWDHLGRLIKLGRVRLRLTPGLTAPGGKFEQSLSLADASVAVTNGDTTVRLWIDAHWPRLVIDVTSRTPCQIEASLDPWRTAARTLSDRETHGACGLEGGPVPLVTQPDRLVTDEPDAVVWYQRNETSVWALTLDQQALGAFKAKSRDPLLHHTFGGRLTGAGFVRQGDSTLTTTSRVTSATLVLSAQSAQTATLGEWLTQLRAAAPSTASADHWRDHVQWWKEFWDRSYIRPVCRAPDWGQAALIAEAFTPRLRYSGASIGYQLASIIAGGPAPLIATALFAAYHSGYAVAIYIAACAVVSLVATWMMPDHTGKDISAEYDA